MRRLVPLLALIVSPALGAELRHGDLALVVRRDGCGFIDSLRFQGRQVAAAREGLGAATVTLTPAGDGSGDSLFPLAPAATLRAAIERLEVEGHALVATGRYVGEGASVPFARRIELADGAVVVREEADFSRLDARFHVAEHVLRLPLAVCGDEHLRMFAFGCADRAELFRMDMNDIHRGGKQLISAPRGHWPYWDLGGVLQLPTSYRVWRANHADTMAYPVDEGQGAPGWADYSEVDWGVTAVVERPADAAPWAIEIDARQGLLAIAPRPASQLPLPGPELGRRPFAFRLVLHTTSWPATMPCELPLDLYAALLKDMATGRDRPMPWVLYRLVGTAHIPTIIHRERVQPSTMLRTLYRGDAWQMQARMKSIGRSVPRNQPMAQWEEAAREYLEVIRQRGLP
ncbi:MAG: hypothetical protein ACLF0G_14225 [Candidatus Brocadiia bacterium]